MIRKKKKFAWPKKLYDKPRILDENKLVDRYGLKNKKEIWKTEAKVKYFRNRAKKLITTEYETQKAFFNNLNRIGLNIKTIADVLALNKEDLLKRRLSTVVWNKKLTNSAKQARQMIVHKRIMIGDKIINVPSYLVKVDEEAQIKIKSSDKKSKTKNETPEKLTDNNLNEGAVENA